MLSSHDNHGFTLLEVMVALAVFALAASMLMLVDGNIIRQTRHIQEKVLSAQVADTALSRIQTEKKWPNKGVQERVEAFGGYDWRIRQEVLETSEKDFRKISVDIFPANEKITELTSPVFSLSTYLRKPHK